MLRKITLKHKVTFLSLFGIGVSVLLALLAIYALSSVGKKLKTIAEEDIPLTNAVTNITVHQLEQAVLFERAIRYAEFMAEDQHMKKEYEKSKAAFLKMAKKVDKEILAAEEQVHHIIEYETSHGGAAELIEEFKHVEKILKSVEKQHTNFDHHVEKVFALFEAGQRIKAEHEAEKVDAEEDKLDHELEALLAELGEFTANAALEAEHIEKEFLNLLIVLTIVTSVVSAGLGFLVGALDCRAIEQH